MDTPTQAPEISSLFERFLRERDLSVFLPFILGFTDDSTRNPDQETSETTSSTTEDSTRQRDRIILINPFTQGMAVIEGASSIDSLLRALTSNNENRKNGQPPASKASIEAMPSVEISDGDEEGECVMCLEEWELGEVAREMPCKHRFHSKCIEEWLGIHGSCPVCRYKMPVDEEETGKKREEERRRGEREIWVSFSFNSRRRRSSDEDQVIPGDSTEEDASLTSRTVNEMEG
ncbi:E3 ubiquitin-protein ligase RNF181-like [Carica papaya]|uniref:E3 ubiquitin-protein ligase RNF181-like n=1 Tax=Carica papaya TaxID=3649 RepID=UPI000B8CAAE8|nr:E3 ubiquitin-protein ligase RNF181-like [Carica papaya]